MEPIKKIINQQKVEERRNSVFYCQIRSMNDEFAWIHSMVCVYLHDSLCDGDKDDDEENKDTDTIYNLLDEFETALRWYHTEGIDKSIENIKSFFKEQFIPYSSYLSYLESKEFENKIQSPEVFIKKLFSKL